jgi:GNAT superfamily N-acetyltransferase
MEIRKSVIKDQDHLIQIADATGVFKSGEAQQLFTDILNAFYSIELGEGHEVFVAEEGDNLLGWVYFSPSFKADSIWDLWWIGVLPENQQTGVGSKLLAFVEDFVQTQSARMLIIETSSTNAFDEVRKFYLNKGYSDCGTIPDFYGDGDGKVTFARKF